MCCVVLWCVVLCCVVLCDTQTLSSILWFVSKQGTLVLDCSSEKVLWLDALSTWRSSNVCTASSRREDTRRRSHSGSNSNSSSISISSNNGGRALQSGEQLIGFTTKISQYSSNKTVLHGHGAGATSNAGTGSGTGTGSGSSRSQKITASFSTAAALIGTMSMPSLEDIASSTSLGANGVAANAKKLQSATTDLVRAFSVRNTLSAFSASTTSTSTSPAPAPAPSPSSTHRASAAFTLPPSPKLTPLKPHTQLTEDILEQSQPVRTRSSTSYDREHYNKQGGGLDSPSLHPEGPCERERERQSTAATADESLELLDFLDAVTGPLSLARAQLETSLLLSIEAQSEAAACVRSGLRNIAHSVVGVSVLNVLTSEVIKSSAHFLCIL